MPKYIIEGGINFYEELHQPLSSNENEADTKTCLLTKLPLTYGHITLPCMHTFNFLPLYNEALSQKTNPDLLKNAYHIIISKNHIKCPYCRTVHANSLLPYIVGSGNRRVAGVNGPAALCLPVPFKCQHAVTKLVGRGKNKQTVLIECAAIKNIYFCANSGTGGDGNNGSEDAKFLCKKHCPHA